MEGNNNPPFSEGQKVVCLKTGRTIKKDDIVTVAKQFQCPCCKKWYIGCAEYPVTFDDCACFCDHYFPSKCFYIGGPAEFFAPIEKREHSISVDKEVLDSLPKETKETVDPFVLKPQTVNNQDMEKVNLTKTITQLEPDSNKVQSELLITVEYDPEEKVVTQVICIHVREPNSKALIDVTAIIAEHFDDSLEKHLEATDWWEIYRAEQEAKKEAA